MSVGERIRAARMARGLNQNEVADRIGVLKQTLYKYENGVVSNIPSDKIEAIAAVLNVSPAYLMGWEAPDCDLLLQCFGRTPYALVEQFLQLDEVDRQALSRMAEVMLQDPKYKKDGSSAGVGA